MPINTAHVVNKLTKTSSVLDQVNRYDSNRYNTPFIIVWLDNKIDEDILRNIDESKVLLLGNYNSLKKLFVSIKFIKKNNILLLHCHHTKSGFWSRFISKICGIKIYMKMEEGIHHIHLNQEFY